jgi:hypothetical protein
MGFFAYLTGGVDSFLIAPYRWLHDPVLGWLLGTLFVALWATLLGEITLALAFRVNRFRVQETSQEMTKRHNQSINALKAGDKDSYKAINKLANEAYGKNFFLQLAMASASLWPVAFALAWLNTRFSEIAFPLPFSLPRSGNTVSYPFVFIPLYILTRIAFSNVKKLFMFLKNS